MKPSRNAAPTRLLATWILSLLIASGLAGCTSSDTSSALQPVYVLEGNHVIRVSKGDRIVPRGSTNGVEVAHDGIFASHVWLEKVRRLEVDAYANE